MTRWSKLVRWARLFSEYAGAQGMVQGLGLAAGLWLVRLLPVREYALYTLSLSILTFVAVFSDMGTSSALSHFRRETRIRREPFEPYVGAALALRRALLALGGAFGVAFMLFTGLQRGFGLVEIALVASVLVPAVWAQIDASTAMLIMRLEERYRESYLAEVSGTAARLAGVAAMALGMHAAAWLALGTSALGSLVTRAVLRTRKVLSATAAHRLRSPEATSIVRYMMPTVPSTAYFSIQAALTVWLAAYFGGTASIAQVGALGRLGVVFGLLSGFLGAVLIPRLAAVTDDAHYLRRYMHCWTVLVPLGLVVVGAALTFPRALLAIIGSKYDGLEDELRLVAISSVLNTWGGFAVAINNARGWVRLQPLALVIYASVQVALIAFLDLSTTIGVLSFGAGSALAGLLLQLALNVMGFRKS